MSKNTLQQIWPDMSLLLCMFYVWQVWHNEVNKPLRCIPKGDERIKIQHYMVHFLMHLLKEINEYLDALAA